MAEESDSALGFLAGAAVCECDLIAKVRDDMLAKCIAALEDECKKALRDLREKP